MATRCFSPPETKKPNNPNVINKSKPGTQRNVWNMWGCSRSLSGPSHQIITTNGGPALRQYQCHWLQTGKTDFHLIEKKKQQDAKIFPTVSDSAFITYELCVASWKQAAFCTYKYCWQREQQWRKLGAETIPPTPLKKKKKTHWQLSHTAAVKLMRSSSCLYFVRSLTYSVTPHRKISAASNCILNVEWKVLIHYVFTWAKWVAEWC